jgi:hypothetical protein
MKHPQAVNVAFLGCPDYPSVLKTLSAAKEKLGEILSGMHACPAAMGTLVVSVSVPRTIYSRRDVLLQRASFWTTRRCGL